MSRIAADELTLRYLDGAATPDEVAALEARLRDDPAARRAFVRMAHLHALASELAHAPLAEARPRRRWRWAAGLVAAAAALAIGCWFLAPEREHGPTLSRCAGAVVCRRDGHELPTAAGMRLRPGDAVRLADDARVGIGWSDGAVVVAEVPGEFVIGEATGARLRLERGAVTAIVVHDPARRFAIATPEATITDTGTRFTITRDGARTRVAVAQGEVSLAAAGSRVAVHAGEKALAIAGRQPRLQHPPVATALPTSIPGWEAALPADARPMPLPAPLLDATAWRLESAGRIAIPAGSELRPVARRGTRAEILGSAPLPDLGAMSDSMPRGLRLLVLTDAAAGREWALGEPELLRAGGVSARELHEEPLGQSRALPLLGGVLLERDARGERPHALAVAVPGLRVGTRLRAAPGSGGGIGTLLASHGAYVVAESEKPQLFIEPHLAHEAAIRERLERELREAVPTMQLVTGDEDDGEAPHDGGF